MQFLRGIVSFVQEKVSDPLWIGNSSTYIIINKMNTTEITGNWFKTKSKLKNKFAALTDNDLLFAEGKKDEMIERLQIKLGKTKEELQKIIASF